MNVLAETRPVVGKVSPTKAHAVQASKDGSTARALTDWTPEVNGNLQRGKNITPADWENAIQQCCVRGTTHTLDLARIVFAARKALPHGEWARLWRAGRIAFSKRKAEMLAVVGRGLGDLNAQTFAHLPSGWSTLYYLARLARPFLNSLIADGTIHLALTLMEAKALLARFNGRPDQPAKCQNVRHRLRQFKHFVRATSETWNAAERDFVRAELQELAVHLESQSRSATPLHPIPIAWAECAPSEGEGATGFIVTECELRGVKSLPPIRLGPLNNQT